VNGRPAVLEYGIWRAEAWREGDCVHARVLLRLPWDEYTVWDEPPVPAEVDDALDLERLANAVADAIGFDRAWRLVACVAAPNVRVRNGA
jgi:hypothetical protein